MPLRRFVILATAVSLVVGALTSCSTSGAGRCVDYVSLATPRARFHAAELVVEAQVTKTHRTVSDFSVYLEYQARIRQVLKGPAMQGTLRVISTSDQCETLGQAARYVAGDRLAKQGSLVLYLVRSGAAGVWRLVVPGAVDPPAVARSLPAA